MKRNFFKDTSPLKKGITIILAIIFLANVILMIAGFQHTILIVITLEIPIVYMIVCFIQDIKKSKFSTPDLTLEQKKLYRMAWSGINHIQIYEKSMVKVNSSLSYYFCGFGSRLRHLVHFGSLKISFTRDYTDNSLTGFHLSI